jgi:hypothetical protein
MRNVRFKVNSSVYGIDYDIYSRYQDTLLKFPKTAEEKVFLDNFSELVSIFNKNTKHLSYIDSSQFNTLDIGCAIDRPEPQFLREASNEDGVLGATFHIPIEVYEENFSEYHEFVDWYIRHYSSLLRRIVAKFTGHKVIQPHNTRPVWDLKQDTLVVGIKYKVVFS